MVLGQLVGVLAIESEARVAYTVEDEALLGVVSTLVASAIEIDWAHERAAGDAAADGGTRAVVTPPSPATTRVRFFAVDGSTFLDGDYLIKGVAGRVLRVLLGHHAREGRVDFTNKEVRLDPSLELPDVRDNLESRLILLKRRLDERDAPIRIEKTGRGRFRLLIDGELRLEDVEPDR
jgi:adenylate cyclase